MNGLYFTYISIFMISKNIYICCLFIFDQVIKTNFLKNTEYFSTNKHITLSMNKIMTMIDLVRLNFKITIILFYIKLKASPIFILFLYPIKFIIGFKLPCYWSIIPVLNFYEMASLRIIKVRFDERLLTSIGYYV